MMPAVSVDFSPDHLTNETGKTFVSSLSDPKVWSAIPLLNYTALHELKDMSIVRFRGMIQDMQDPEMYLERYEVIQNDNTCRLQDGKYRDCLLLNEGERINPDAKSNIHGERRTLFVISIPALNNWCQEYETQCSRYNLPKPINTEVTERKKRSAPMEVDSVQGETSVEPNSDTDVNKRKRITEQIDESVVNNEVNRSSNGVIGMEYHLNSPISSRPSKACMIRIYDDFEKYKLNTIVDVVGFLSVNPALDAATMDVDVFDNISEIQAQNPPPSIIPRLHAIAVHCLPHPNPLLDERFLWRLDERNSTDATDDFNMLAVGSELRIFLKLCLFNDSLAAEYLLSHLISSVYCRAESRCLGRFLLNLFNIPHKSFPQYTKKVYELLDLLIPASHYITMTADTMNDSTFGPKKDYETNKLVSGMLQLAPQTHLVIDETFTKSETLNSNGILSMQILGHVMKHQQLRCNFQYYEIEYEVDIPILCFSKNKSVLPYDAFVPIEYDEQSLQVIEESLKAANHYLNATRLNQFRRFLTKGKLAEFSVNQNESEMVQNDFVEMRKNKTIRDAEELHHLLVLARLLAVARGKNVLDKDAWELAKQMEATRQHRLNAISHYK